VALLPQGAKPYDVVGFGESSLDLVAVVDRFPKPDSKLALEEFEQRPGGQAATAVTACARQGWRARYVGALGSDEWGAAIEAALAREHVDVAAVRRPGVPSRMAIVIVERATGRRTVLEHRDRRLRLTTDDVDPAVVTSGRVLMLDAVDIEASTAAARAARAAGIPTVLDIERPAPGVDGLLAEIDVMIAAESFPVAHTGAASLIDGLHELMARFRPALVVATCGAAGSVAICGAREIRTPAPVVRAVDTTGAGDAFRGGFVSGWLRYGPDAPIERLLAYANAVAALSCEGLGAQTALPTRQATDAFVACYRNQP
jgi:ribokinase